MDKYEVVIIETMTVRTVYHVKATSKDAAFADTMYGESVPVREDYVETIDRVTESITLITEGDDAPTT